MAMTTTPSRTPLVAASAAAAAVEGGSAHGDKTVVGASVVTTASTAARKRTSMVAVQHGRTTTTTAGSMRRRSASTQLASASPLATGTASPNPATRRRPHQEDARQPSNQQQELSSSPVVDEAQEPPVMRSSSYQPSLVQATQTTTALDATEVTTPDNCETASNRSGSVGSDDNDDLLHAATSTSADSRRVTQLEQLVVRLRGQLQEKNVLFNKLEVACAGRTKQEVMDLQHAHDALVRTLRADACALDVQVRSLNLQCDQLRGKLRQAEDGMRAEAAKHRDCRVQLNMAEKELAAVRQSAEATTKQAAHGRKLLRDQLHDAKQQIADKERKVLMLQQQLQQQQQYRASEARCRHDDDNGDDRSARSDGSAQRAAGTAASPTAARTASPGPHPLAAPGDDSPLPTMPLRRQQHDADGATTATPIERGVPATVRPDASSASASSVSPLPASAARRGRSLSYSSAVVGGAQQQQRHAYAASAGRTTRSPSSTSVAPPSAGVVTVAAYEGMQASHQRDLNELRLQLEALREEKAAAASAFAAAEAALNDRVVQLEDALRVATTREQTLKEKFEDATESYETEISSLAANLSKWREAQQQQTRSQRSNTEVSQMRAMSIDAGGGVDAAANRGLVVEVPGEAVPQPQAASSIYTSSPTGSSPPPLLSFRGDSRQQQLPDEYNALVDECSGLHMRVTEQSVRIRELESSLHGTVERKELLEESRRGLLHDVSHLQHVVQTYWDIAPADVTRHVNTHCGGALASLRMHHSPSATALQSGGRPTPHGAAVRPPYHDPVVCPPAAPSSSLPRSPSSVFGTGGGASGLRGGMTADDLTTVADSEVGTTAPHQQPASAVPMLPWGPYPHGAQHHHQHHHELSPTPSFPGGGGVNGDDIASSAAAEQQHHQQLQFNLLRRMQEDISLLRRQMYTDYWFSTASATVEGGGGASAAGAQPRGGVHVEEPPEEEEEEGGQTTATHSVAATGLAPTPVGGDRNGGAPGSLMAATAPVVEGSTAATAAPSDPTTTMPHGMDDHVASLHPHGDASCPCSTTTTTVRGNRISLFVPSLPVVSALVAVAGVVFAIVSGATAFSGWLSAHGSSSHSGSS